MVVLKTKLSSSSNGCLLSLQSPAVQQHHKEGNSFLGYIQSNCLFKAGYYQDGSLNNKILIDIHINHIIFNPLRL
jgi:hypothetical protein